MSVEIENCDCTTAGHPGRVLVGWGRGWDTCPSCAGFGNFPKDGSWCHRCSGDGTVVRKRVPSYQGDETVSCPCCGGDGVERRS